MCNIPNLENSSNFRSPFDIHTMASLSPRRCRSCGKQIHSNHERATGQCSGCMLKKSNASNTLAGIALVGLGAAVGFVGGYLASLWTEEKTKQKQAKQAISANKFESTHFVDPDDDVASCPICYDKRVNIALSPCGHTLCGECTDELQSDKCPMCARTITGRQTIYIN